MKKKGLFFSFLLFIFCSFNLLAENFPQKASKVEDFIPKGWKKLIVEKGDLNKDKIDDVVLVIEKNDPKNFKKIEDSSSSNPVNFNPRIILVLFKDKNSKYTLVAKNDKNFIVSPGYASEEGLETLDSPDYDDNLSKAVTIKNNILHISRTMDIGGAERIVYQLSSDLKDEFDSVHVASTGGLWEPKLEAQGIIHHKIHDIDSKNPLTVLKLLLTIYQIIKTNDITLVHTHHRMAAFYIRLLKLINPKLVHVYTAHNVFKDKLSLYRFSLKNAYSIAVGQAVNQNLKDDVGVANSTVIYNGVILKQSNRQVDEIMRFDGIKLGCIARLSEQKGLTYLLDAISLISDENLRLFIVGDGELRAELENKVKELNLEDKVTFLGYRQDIVECINSFDFLVSSSLFEGLALNVIEAFMNGKTMVATDIPGINEVVTKENGILVPAKDARALASAIESLATDSTLRTRLAHQAKKDYEEKFSYPLFLENYRKFYQKLMGDSK